MGRGLTGIHTPTLGFPQALVVSVKGRTPSVAVQVWGHRHSTFDRYAVMGLRDHEDPVRCRACGVQHVFMVHTSWQSSNSAVLRQHWCGVTRAVHESSMGCRKPSTFAGSLPYLCTVFARHLLHRLRIWSQRLQRVRPLPLMPLQAQSCSGYWRSCRQIPGARRWCFRSGRRCSTSWARF